MNSEVSKPSDITRRQALVLALILMVGATARFNRLGQNEAHFDELWHLELSTGRGSAHNELPRNVLLTDAPDVTSLSSAPPIARVCTSLGSVTHPPLFSLLLRSWRTVFGESIVAARALSAIASVLCLIVLFDVVRVMNGTKPALWATAIFALAPSQLEVARESRNYALAVLFLLLAANAIARIQVFGVSRSRVVWLACATCAAMFTHYFTTPVLFGLVVYATVAMHSAARRATVAAVAVAAGVFLLLWGPMIPSQLEAMKIASIKGSLGETSQNPAIVTFQRLAALPIRQLSDPQDVARSQLALVVLVISISASIYVLPFLLAALRGRRDLLMWGLWLAACGVFLGALDFLRETRHLAQLRHTIFAAPAVIAIVASVAISGRVLSNLVPGIALSACGLALFFGSGDRIELPFSAIADRVSGQLNGPVPIVFYSDPTWRADLLYLGTSHYSPTFPRACARLDGAASPALSSELRKLGDQLLLVRADGPLSPQEILPGATILGAWDEPPLGHVVLMKWDDVQR